MIKFYKVEKSDTLLVVDTEKSEVVPFDLEDKPYYDLNALREWWGNAEVSDYFSCPPEELAQFIFDGIEEIK